MTRLAESNAWRAVLEHGRRMGRYDLRQTYADDPGRFDRFSMEHGGLLLDYSKHLLDADAMQLLLELARERDVPGAIERMFRGERINNTENRAALHVALRGGGGYAIDGIDVSAEVARVLHKMRSFTDRVRSGEHLGHTGERITDVVNIGIGGSYLGPELA
jgi:glucose-6-phosphate isomerase